MDRKAGNDRSGVQWRIEFRSAELSSADDRAACHHAFKPSRIACVDGCLQLWRSLELGKLEYAAFHKANFARSPVRPTLDLPRLSVAACYR